MKRTPENRGNILKPLHEQLTSVFMNKTPQGNVPNVMKMLLHLSEQIFELHLVLFEGNQSALMEVLDDVLMDDATARHNESNPAVTPESPGGSPPHQPDQE